MQIKNKKLKKRKEESRYTYKESCLIEDKNLESTYIFFHMRIKRKQKEVRELRGRKDMTKGMKVGTYGGASKGRRGEREERLEKRILKWEKIERRNFES